MRGKTYLLLVVVLLLSLTAPAAHASSGDPLSPARTGQESGVPADAVPLPELPAVEIRMTAISNSSGASSLQVTAEQLLQAVETVAAGDAVRIAITADSEEEVSSVSAAMPREALAAVVDRTDAEVSVTTRLGQITLSNTAVAGIVEQSEESEIIVTMARGASGKEVDILSGGKSITGWSSVDGPAVVSPLAAAVEDVHGGVRNVRLYAAWACIAAAVLILAGMMMKRCQGSRKSESFEKKS